MVATDQADVIVFANRTAAKEYVSHADDQASRVGRVVLSFGNPPRVVPQSQPRYVRVLRNVLR
jgi:predicted dinucleotide-binding enzyme